MPGTCVTGTCMPPGPPGPPEPPTPAPALPAAPPAEPAIAPCPWCVAPVSWSMPAPEGREPDALGGNVLPLPGSPDPKIFYMILLLNEVSIFKDKIRKRIL